MAPEIGHFALILALAISLAQSVVPIIGARRGNPELMNFGSRAALGQCAFIVIAFAALTYAFVTSDFSVEIVNAGGSLQHFAGAKVQR